MVVLRVELSSDLVYEQQCDPTFPFTCSIYLCCVLYLGRDVAPTQTLVSPSHVKLLGRAPRTPTDRRRRLHHRMSVRCCACLLSLPHHTATQYHNRRRHTQCKQDEAFVAIRDTPGYEARGAEQAFECSADKEGVRRRRRANCCSYRRKKERLFWGNRGDCSEGDTTAVCCGLCEGADGTALWLDVGDMFPMMMVRDRLLTAWDREL